MNRNTKRPGIGPHLGSINNRRTISSIEPILPKNRDQWIDTSVNPAVEYYYDTATTTWILISSITQALTLIIKDSNEQVTSSTAVQNDNDIIFSLQANSIYEIEFHGSAYSTSATPDIKLKWVVTGGASALTARVCMGLGTTETDHTNGVMRCSRHTIATEVPYGVVAGATSCEIFEKFIVSTSTAGTLTLQWAQNTSNATAVGLSTSTFAIARLIS